MGRGGGGEGGRLLEMALLMEGIRYIGLFTYLYILNLFFCYRKILVLYYIGNTKEMLQEWSDEAVFVAVVLWCCFNHCFCFNYSIILICKKTEHDILSLESVLSLP